MAIARVQEEGIDVVLYDDNGKRTGSVTKGNAPGDGLIDFTPTTVRIKRQGRTFCYDQGGIIKVCPRPSIWERLRRHF
jgi:hypothetical protein